MVAYKILRRALATTTRKFETKTVNYRTLNFFTTINTTTHLHKQMHAFNSNRKKKQTSKTQQQ